MKTRIALIIALVTGLTVTGLNLFSVRETITTLRSNLEQQTASRLKADFERTTAALRQATTSLEKVTAVAKVFTLNKDLTSLRQQYDQALAEMASYRTKTEPEQNATLAKQIKNIREDFDVAQEVNKILTERVRRLTQIGCRWPREGYVVTMPADLQGKVLVLDPKWHFVVLDAGEDQGVVEDGELLVNRNGKLVAKVIVRRAEKNRCIANVMQGWSLAEIKEGDAVIAAHPGS